MTRLDPDRSVATVLSGVSVSNGLAWTVDGSRALFVDSPTQRIDVLTFDADAGSFVDRRPLVEIPAECGMPDGLTVDREGGVWVALWGGAAVRRYTMEGRLDEIVGLPVPHVTACAFGGDELTDLYITTSRIGAADHHAPELAGAVFVVDPGAQGLLPNAYAG